MLRVNQVVIGGIVESAPILKATALRRPVLPLRVKSTEVWIDGQGVQQSRSDVHDVVIYDKAAEGLVTKLHLGCGVILAGKMRAEDYVDREKQPKRRKFIETRDVSIWRNASTGALVNEENLVRINMATIGGYLGANPELKFTQHGRGILPLRVATTDIWFDADNQKQTRTDWHDIVLFGKEAESLSKILRSGSGIVAIGKCRTDEYVDTSNHQQIRKSVEAREVHLADKMAHQSGRAPARYTDRSAPAGANPPENWDSDGAKGFQGDNGGGDDIPF